mmetsp:Transcript_31360/g.60382  ORF Transcript_31360/g.60382 Transcript_31360/m.60382 type:complete len:225 (-) Transcript_31360:491-1165(-)
MRTVSCSAAQQPPSSDQISQSCTVWQPLSDALTYTYLRGSSLRCSQSHACSAPSGESFSNRPATASSQREAHSFSRRLRRCAAGRKGVGRSPFARRLNASRCTRASYVKRAPRMIRACVQCRCSRFNPNRAEAAHVQQGPRRARTCTPRGWRTRSRVPPSRAAASLREEKRTIREGAARTRQGRVRSEAKRPHATIRRTPGPQPTARLRGQGSQLVAATQTARP